MKLIRWYTEILLKVSLFIYEYFWMNKHATECGDLPLLNIRIYISLCDQTFYPAINMCKPKKVIDKNVFYNS